AGSALFPFITGALASKVGIKSLQPLLVGMMSLMVGLWMLVPAGQRKNFQEIHSPHASRPMYIYPIPNSKPSQFELALNRPWHERESTESGVDDQVMFHVPFSQMLEVKDEAHGPITSARRPCQIPLLQCAICRSPLGFRLYSTEPSVDTIQAT
ncbi:hypothetical protein FIBSPDRAFT_901468, partial [Athelia psychrophila]